MWYFILALLFGNPSNTDTNHPQALYSVQDVDNEGNTGPVRPGK
ncbi:hypothetical protein [Sphingobacterium kitahiroshimense]|uniref:Uncharacterized protein n=1 Tax=Sphingobacterium kitahiroshimense TaxID=470446 RepID=A0ABV0BNT0_9SPHI